MRHSSILVQVEEYSQIIKNRFYKLQQDLVLKEDYIIYLEKEILIRDKELDPLWQEISDIKERLEKVLQDTKIQENYIDYIEKHLLIFQDENDKLNQKIQALNIIYPEIKNSIDMAYQPRPPGSPNNRN